MLIISKIVNSMEKIFPETEPVTEEYTSLIFKNEKLHFQLAYKNESEASYKCFSIETRGALAPYVTLRKVVLMPATRLPTKYADDYYLKHTVGLYPELLCPFDALGVCLPSDQWRAFWVTIEKEDGLPAGVFDTEFILKDDNGNEVDTLKYTVEVVDGELVQTDLKLSNWMHYDCIANAHDVEPFTEEYYAVFEKYLKAYTEGGWNMLLTPLFTPPLDTKIGGERRTAQLVGVEKKAGVYIFDFLPLKKFIRFVMERGISYIEFSHLFTQWGGKCCPKIMATVNGKQEKIFGWETASNSPEYEDFLTQFLPALVEVIKELGIEKKCCFHITDEPSEEHLAHYEQCYKTVKKHIGEIPTMDAISEYSFFERGAVDIPVPVANTFSRFQNKGIKELFFYYCCGPTNMYFTNRLMNMPSQRTRVLGYQLYETGVQGFLHWGFNFYNSQHSICQMDPYTQTSAGDMFPSGDSFIVYPTKEGGVLKSLRAETLAEGFYDYRALKTLEGYIGREKVLELLHEEGIEGLITYPRNAGRHARFRQKINTLIKEKIGEAKNE